MTDFILGFKTYPTMNSWNNANGYSYNVKIHSLPLKSGEKDALYDMLSADGFYDSFNDIIEDWQASMKKYGTYSYKKEITPNVEGKSKKHIAAIRKAWETSGYTFDRCGTARLSLWKMIDKPIFEAGFNGRSGGHLVLYKWNGHNMAGTGWNHDKEELEDMSAEDVRYVYNVLKDFERLYTRLLNCARYMAKNYKVEEEEYTVTKTRNVLADK